MNLIRMQPKKPRRTGRLRSPGHLAWVRKCCCAVSQCYNLPVEAAHWRLGAHAGVSQKPDDDRAIPLCGEHHKEAHRIGEETFAKKYKLDIAAILAELRRYSPPLRRPHRPAAHARRR